MRSRRMSVLMVSLSLAVVLVPLGSTAVAAVGFTVDSTDDTVDVTPGDGVCADSLGECSLRAAVMEANVLAGADTITLPAGVYGLAIAGRDEQFAATGDLDIRGPLVINGAGSGLTIIDGGGIDRVIETIQANVSITSVTIRNGAAGTSNGGGIRVSRCPDTCSFGGLLTVTGSVVSGNSANRGGGLSNDFSKLTVINTTITGNTASDVGGGIFNDWGSLTVTSSTISRNSARTYGGGVFTRRNSNAVITNSTISGNTASSTASIRSGGIYHFNSGLTIVSSTVSGNAGGIHSAAPDAFTPARVKNTIIAENGPSDCSADTALISWGYNIIGDNSCGLTGTGDLNNTDALLGPLSSNGGTTATHVPLAGSPAIDVVPLANCTVTTDQRGVSRPKGAACDVGAVEVSDSTPPTIVAGDVIAEATGPAGAVVDYPQPTATDDVDGPVPVSCDPVSGSTFELGETLVECAATDAAGNTGTATFAVSVVDTTEPTIFGAADATAEATGPSGATVEYTPTASDTVDGVVAVSCVPASGSTFSLGKTPVTCAATDAAGNTGSATFTVSVVDTTAPQTTFDGAYEGFGRPLVDGGSTVGSQVRLDFSASDLVGVAGYRCWIDGVPALCRSTYWYPVAVGTHTFTVSAFDAAGNADATLATFTWTRLTPAQGVDKLVALVASLNLSQGLAASLYGPLHEASALLNDGNPANDRAACNKLAPFQVRVGKYQAQGTLTKAQATELDLDAATIRLAVGGC